MFKIFVDEFDWFYSPVIINMLGRKTSALREKQCFGICQEDLRGHIRLRGFLSIFIKSLGLESELLIFEELFVKPCLFYTQRKLR